MTAQTTIDAPPPSSRHALPDPGEAVPTLSWPIVGLFFGALALFAVVELGGAGRSRCRSSRRSR